MNSILDFLTRHKRICARCGIRPRLRRMEGDKYRVYQLCGTCAKQALEDFIRDEDPLDIHDEWSEELDPQEF